MGISGGGSSGGVANAGGAIGVWTHLADSPLALVDVIGVDHVCVGTDTKLTQPFGGRGGGRGGPRVGERRNLAWQDQTAGFYYLVVDVMLKTGFTAGEISKIGGGNFLRISARPFRNSLFDLYWMRFASP